ncbi:hypothetical protein [Streptomyces sp. NBC_01423]|uniref:hypothetical protein n=1 Tax=Streptomyces sp. NBC_01423 TaxID=2903860 RepID=UPI002E285F9F|nr:hypothetical protein [Streptomyces sp. NBC_01423]
MKTVTLRHQFTVPATPEAAVSYLMKPSSYVELNGFVIGVRDVREEEGATVYTAIERLPVLGRHFQSPLKVRVRSEEEGTRFIMEVDTRGGVRVRVVTVFTQVPEGAMADDTITLTAPALLRPYASKQARVGQLHRGKTLAVRLG